VTYRETFVGRLKRPDFDWADPDAGLAADDIELLTASLMDNRIFYLVVERARTFPSRQLDWGSFALRATKEEILALMRDWVVGDHLPGPGDQNHKPKQSRARSLAVVRALPEEDPYVLVTEEF
jgi:hypothetical protein